MNPIVAQANRPHPTTDRRVLDDFARSLSARMPRRSVCRLLGGGTLGAALAGLGLVDVAAGCRSVGERCRRDKECCSGRCVRRKCRRRRKPLLEPVPPGYELPPDYSLPPGYTLPIRRRLTLNAAMEISDDETFGGDEVCRYHDLVAEAVLTSDAPTRRLHLERGCGGEVRVEFNVDATLQEDGTIRTSGWIRLYEGTSVRTSDLDARYFIGEAILHPRETQRDVRTVNNADEGGDWVTISYTTHNGDA